MTGLTMLEFHFVEDYNAKNERMFSGGGRGGFGGGHQGAPPFLPLTVPLQIIQKPFYDFMKAAFTYWPIESNTAFAQVRPTSTSTSNPKAPFHADSPTQVVDAWLTYIQPWDALSTESSSSPSDPAKQVGLIAEKWFAFSSISRIAHRLQQESLRFIQLSLLHLHVLLFPRGSVPEVRLCHLKRHSIR